MEFGIVLGCFVSFVVILIGKLGIRDRVIEKAPKLISELFGCDFCLSFWISTIFALAIAMLLQYPIAVLAPIVSTPIARFLL